mmetsp:Transcript_9332/g.10044  ORF Transcript_9332/g.10044 Transcript_9332/m.10044 type:complete len:88 (-) Transcript_9332:154-417(-)
MTMTMTMTMNMTMTITMTYISYQNTIPFSSTTVDYWWFYLLDGVIIAASHHIVAIHSHSSIFNSSRVDSSVSYLQNKYSRVCDCIRI